MDSPDATEFMRDDEDMQRVFMPLVRRYLPLRRNCDLAGVPRDERLFLNLRREDWPLQLNFMVRMQIDRILGFQVRWR